MRVVFLADLHVGHKAALAHPDATARNSDGYAIRAAFYEAWRVATDGLWHRPDALVINGDAIDGQGQKRGGSEQWTTDVMEQVEHAAELIRMWDAKKIYVIRGSNYHVEAGHTGLAAEELLAQRLEAEKYPDSNARSGWHWYLTFDRLTFHVAHKIGVSRVFHYRSTPIAREMLHLNLNDGLRHAYRDALQKGLLQDLSAYRTRIVVRAHAHYYWTCGTSGSAGFNLPCWQALSPFMMQNGPLAIEPDIGYVGFDIHGDKYRAEPNLWAIEKMQPPPHTIVRDDDGPARQPANPRTGRGTRKRSHPATRRTKAVDRR